MQRARGVSLRRLTESDGCGTGVDYSGSVRKIRPMLLITCCIRIVIVSDLRCALSILYACGEERPDQPDQAKTDASERERGDTGCEG